MRPAAGSANAAQVASLISRWQGVQLTSASELSSSQTFILKLCQLLGVPAPLLSQKQDYMFKRPITHHHRNVSTTPRRVDC